eukprot:TRINITY_DN2773_c0_g1_i1.p1 TRINITY_DN2773_c0_g1~~TRINITY_DN2773_c0_g1_i1.p1  ORF type:complete len:498 (-),score=106.93 TRINITY_DN2773_c0_g1_i1:272-1765(-)
MAFLPPRTQSFIGDPFPSDNTTDKVKTKIICTIGPKSASEEMIGKMAEAGMSIARLNFSHGDYSYHGSVVQNIRNYATSANKTIAIMLDTKGPEIRTGKLVDRKDVKLEVGQLFTFINDESVLGDNTQVSTTYKSLAKTVRVGTNILVDDGLISFTVLHIEEDKVVCRVNNAGVLGETKGVNLPDCTIDLPAVTEKDIADIAFGVESNVDMIACSFIRKASDIMTIRNLPGVTEKNIKIIAKIESQEGLDNFDEILEVSDGIMVARGDLGVEIPIHKICNVQKMMIAKCNKAGKPVITATQMLESMIKNPRPTRAEATDVANAVFDGTDCVMLSGETAKGDYPCETIRTMANICREAESHIDYRELYQKLRANVVPPVSVAESIASSAVKTSWDINAKLVIVLTDTGSSGRLVSKYRPHCPILCVTRSEEVARRMLVHRACFPYLTHSISNSDAVFQRVIEKATELGLCAAGDTVVVTSGSLEGVPGATNILKVITV